MRILIIEDEKKMRDKLLSCVETYNSQWEIAGQFEAISDALSFLKNNPNIDLILSDIELADGNIMQAIGQFPLKIPIIFITAYNQYLQEAFQANSIHYITKPFNYEQIENALKKFEQLRQDFKAFQIKDIGKLLSKIQNQTHYFKSRFLSQQGRRLVVLEAKNISFFEAEQGVVFAYCKEKRMLLKEKSLQQLEELLNPYNFFRINRHQIVHKNYIQGIEPFDKNSIAIKLKQGKTLKTSQGKTKDFRLWLEE